MTDTEPVADWARDYDIFDTDFVKDPYPVWGDLRDGGCPVAHTDRWGGSHMPVTFDGVSEVAHDAERFTSYEVSVAPVPISYDADGNRLRSIIASDDPEHRPERRLMLPFFAPKVVDRYRDHTRELARKLIRGFIEDGYVDAGTDYARQIPPRVIADILGIDPDRSDDFTEWVQGVLELGLTDADIREKYRVIITDFFEEQIADRRENPGDDLISVLVQSELDGEPLPHAVILANVNLMLIAGIDTTWSSIGSALWHLATHPEDRQRLVDEPELIPIAVEEFLRAYSPVTMARLASDDTTIGDDETTVAKGDRVLLSFPAANRDPEHFDRPEEVIIDREVNRHIAFGAGPHRCLGSNLARMEMNVAIEEFLAAIPEFQCQTPDEVTWAGGQVRGPRYLPIHFPVPSGLS
ncbi:MAG: cytochrome P450 [Actinomycetota bacterium]|jgi:cytochrome P450|nr:cytochrome P450 [Actinomycetota bacterium]